MTTAAPPEARLCRSRHQHPQEDLFVLVFEGEVESLGGEVPNVIGQAIPPKGEKGSPLLGGCHTTIKNAFVEFLCTDLFAGMLDLQQQFDPQGQQLSQYHLPRNP